MLKKATILKADGTSQELDHKPTLAEAQKIVGGYIEYAQCTNGRTLIVNEDGLMRRLSLNRQATAIYKHSTIVGDAILLEGWRTI